MFLCLAQVFGAAGLPLSPPGLIDNSFEQALDRLLAQGAIGLLPNPANDLLFASRIVNLNVQLVFQLSDLNGAITALIEKLYKFQMKKWKVTLLILF